MVAGVFTGQPETDIIRGQQHMGNLIVVRRFRIPDPKQAWNRHTVADGITEPCFRSRAQLKAHCLKLCSGSGIVMEDRGADRMV